MTLLAKISVIPDFEIGHFVCYCQKSTNNGTLCPYNGSFQAKRTLEIVITIRNTIKIYKFNLFS
jgi:hypothetical protein